MRKLLVVSLFCVSTIVHAQSDLPPGFVVTNKPMLCGPASVVFRNLASKEINEKPIWLGQDENKSNYAIFVNSETSGFTIIQFGEQMACVLGLGPTSDLFENKLKGKSM